MKRDKSADERLAYDRLILEKEEALDILAEERRDMEENIDNMEVSSERVFYHLQDLNERLIQKGSKCARWTQVDNEEKKRELSRLLGEQREALSHAYRRAADTLEDERMALQKKRGELPWD